LELRDGQLSGQVETGRGDEVALTRPILDPVLEGNKLTFDLKSTGGRAERLTTYQGILADDQIRGLTMLEVRGEQRDSPWSAKKVVSK
jgi:hypothetical protein